MNAQEYLEHWKQGELQQAKEASSGSLQPDCWTAPPSERREKSEVVARRDGYDWRCKYCVETAQECLNGDRGCPYRQPKSEQSNK